jgi:exodeoxyribonuclease-5
MAYQFSPDQVEALQAIGAWWRGKTSPYLTLGGYAGTGKTTLIAYLRQALHQSDEDLRVAFCAYTGKASRVLDSRLRAAKVPRRKDSVSTIHSLIYSTQELPGGGVHWVKKPALERDLIVVDEASMVDERIWSDLCSFGIPILAVGDHGQLPPVGTGFNLMEHPNLRLERVFRQAEGSGILELASLARANGQIPIDSFGNDARKFDRSNPETGEIVQELLENWQPDLLVVCGYNKTRVQLNQVIRAFRGLESQEPQTGDWVVCLRNNVEQRIYNGLTGRIMSIREAGKGFEDWYELEVEPDGEDYRYTGYALKAQFGAPETIQKPPALGESVRGDLWDFGYALTVHKAQGSQAPRVLVFEERFPRSTDQDWRRWLYTAVTRAQEDLTVVGPDPEAVAGNR